VVVKVEQRRAAGRCEMIVEIVEVTAYLVMIGYYGGHIIESHIIRKKCLHKKQKTPKLIKVIH